jgi:MarR family transcriptional regulator, 2-MHQ and catechol-resistance regulon repressor
MGTMVQLPLQSASTGPATRKPDWLPTLLAVVRAYQGFEAVSERNIRKLGLTGPQFDIIATLGNTQGMTCGEVGERTLITKGTLTGVLDRLEAKGLLTRRASSEDRRSIRVKLTRKGEECFETVFPAHLAYMDTYLSRLSADERAAIEHALARFRAVLAPQDDA